MQPGRQPSSPLPSSPFSNYNHPPQSPPSLPPSDSITSTITITTTATTTIAATTVNSHRPGAKADPWLVHPHFANHWRMFESGQSLIIVIGPAVICLFYALEPDDASFELPPSFTEPCQNRATPWWKQSRRKQNKGTDNAATRKGRNRTVTVLCTVQRAQPRQKQKTVAMLRFNDLMQPVYAGTKR